MVGCKLFVRYVRAKIHFGEHADGGTVDDDRIFSHYFRSQFLIGKEFVVLFGTLYESTFYP